ncbi:hypothetical protein POM88_050557 [Heracleum sosnowskyi]|uniref:Uncharacterized protein n=1 Tax=Heracleum sosnowskyi TaxID=360622 RepID=A0AAD8M1M9_9APIA|nr:hypothetical protein POM88_050557 [Heracleum sosnowskyi]
MEDRHSEILAQLLGLDEKYGELIGLLKGGEVSTIGQTSTQRQRTELAPTYSTNIKKFIDDTSSSLDNYTSTFVDNVDTMISDLAEFNNRMTEKLVDLKKGAEHIVEERASLRAWLLDFKNNV